MTPDERADVLRRMVDMNHILRTLMENLNEGADVAKEAGASGVAVATYHLAESLAAYTKAINAWATAELFAQGGIDE